MRNLIWFIAITLALGGCTTAKAISLEQRDSITSVSVAPEVKIAPNADFIGGIGKLLAPGIGGVIGGAIDAGERDKDKTFTEFLTSSGIKVEDICRNQLISRLKADPFWGTRYNDGKGYSIRIEVPHYSFFRKNTFSDLYRPGVLIRYELLDPSGQVVAHGVGTSGAFNDKLPEHTLEEVRSNPELLKNAYAQAADEAITKILQSLTP